MKGQFSGIKNNEVAVVMWHGVKGEELLYQARKLEQLTDDKPVNGHFPISTTDTGVESFVLIDGLLSGYSLKMNKADNIHSRQIRCTLKPSKRGLLPEYIMNYPGND